jgi:hypothetical protein
MHGALKYRSAGAMSSIVLLDPPRVQFSDVVEAHFKGYSILSRAADLAPEFLIRGVSAFRRRSWSEAVAELWICIEQLTTSLWESSLPSDDATFAARKDILKNNQMWTASVRQEVLFQRSLLDVETYSHLFSARQARNALSHRGKTLSEENAVNALIGMVRLLGVVTYNNPDALTELITAFRATPYVYRQPKKEFFDRAAKWRPVGALANRTLPFPNRAAAEQNG